MRAMQHVYKVFAAAAIAITVTSPGAAEMVSVKRPQTTLRDGPGTRHEALWLVDRGYPLAVHGRRGAWLHVRDFEGDDAWVYGPLTGKIRHHVVKATVANIRRAPSRTAPVVGRAVYGEVLRTLGARRDWVNVRNGEGLRGWVFRRLLWGW